MTDDTGSSSGDGATTVGAAEAAGDVGGAECSSSDAPIGLAWAAGLALITAGLLRSRRGAGLALLLAAVLGAWPPTALAQDDDSDDDPAEEQRREAERLERQDANPFVADLTPAWGNVEIRYGPMTFTDTNITDAYGSNNNVLHIEAGVQILQFLEIDAGTGLYTTQGVALTALGEETTRTTELTFFPFTLGGTLRAHILDEQPLVPYVSAGLDMFVWNEIDTSSEPNKVLVDGVKFGWHWAVGGQVLLDFLDPGRASLLEAQTGINDTWLTVDYRTQEVGGGAERLDFSAEVLTVGLKFDF